MNNRLCCNRAQRPPASNPRRRPLLYGDLVCLWYVPQVAAGDAPEWMRALVSAPLPAHDEKTDAILLYSEKNVNVISADKVKEQVRVAYKILRPGGREYGYRGSQFQSSQEGDQAAWLVYPGTGKRV